MISLEKRIEAYLYMDEYRKRENIFGASRPMASQLGLSREDAEALATDWRKSYDPDTTAQERACDDHAMQEEGQ